MTILDLVTVCLSHSGFTYNKSFGVYLSLFHILQVLIEIEVTILFHVNLQHKLIFFFMM